MQMAQNPAVENHLLGILDENEQVLWEGKPDRHTYLRPYSYRWIVIFLGAIILFFPFRELIASLHLNLLSIGTVVMLLIFISIVFISLLIIPIAPFFYHRWLWKRISYAVTNKRLIISYGNNGYRMKSLGGTLDISSIPSPFTKRNDLRNLYFDNVVRSRFEFICIPNGEEVNRVIRQANAEALARAHDQPAAS
jgi:hypothetical protein